MSLSDYVLGQDYFEYKTTGMEDYSPGANSARRVLDFYDWENRFDFMAALLGWCSGEIGDIKREPPDVHPENDLFICTGATVEPVGPPGQRRNEEGVLVADFTIARITATYSSVTYQIPGEFTTITNDYPNTFISRSSTISGQYLSLQTPQQFVTRAFDLAKYPAESGDKPPNGTLVASRPGKIVAQQELIITHHNIPGGFDEIPNWDTIVSLMGTVNPVDPAGLFEGQPPGGVLYLGCNARVTVPSLINEQPTWTLEHRFIIMNNGEPGGQVGVWIDGQDGCRGNNYIFDTQYNRWDLIVATSDGKRVTQATLGDAIRLYQPGKVSFRALFGAAIN